MENVNIVLAIAKASPYLASLLILVFSFKKSIVEYIKYKTFNKKRRIKELEYHDVFNTITRVKTQVGNMKFYTHGKFDTVKSKMCYDFTKHKGEECYRYMKEIANNTDIDKMKKSELKDYIIYSQVKMHINYIKAIKTDWSERGIPKDDIEYVIHLFEKFRYDVVASFEHRINAIFGNEFHNSNFDRVLSVFDMWAMGVDLLPKDMQTTFENINGKFKDIKY